MFGDDCGVDAGSLTLLVRNPWVDFEERTKKTTDGAPTTKRGTNVPYAGITGKIRTIEDIELGWREDPSDLIPFTPGVSNANCHGIRQSTQTGAGAWVPVKSSKSGGKRNTGTTTCDDAITSVFDIQGDKECFQKCEDPYAYEGVFDWATIVNTDGSTGCFGTTGIDPTTEPRCLADEAGVAGCEEVPHTVFNGRVIVWFRDDLGTLRNTLVNRLTSNIFRFEVAIPSKIVKSTEITVYAPIECRAALIYQSVTFGKDGRFILQTNLPSGWRLRMGMENDARTPGPDRRGTRNSYAFFQGESTATVNPTPFPPNPDATLPVVWKGVDPAKAPGAVADDWQIYGHQDLASVNFWWAPVGVYDQINTNIKIDRFAPASSPAPARHANTGQRKAGDLAVLQADGTQRADDTSCGAQECNQVWGFTLTLRQPTLLTCDLNSKWLITNYITPNDDFRACIRGEGSCDAFGGDEDPFAPDGPFDASRLCQCEVEIITEDLCAEVKIVGELAAELGTYSCVDGTAKTSFLKDQDICFGLDVTTQDIPSTARTIKRIDIAGKSWGTANNQKWIYRHNPPQPLEWRSRVTAVQDPDCSASETATQKSFNGGVGAFDCVWAITATVAEEKNDNTCAGDRADNTFCIAADGNEVYTFEAALEVTYEGDSSRRRLLQAGEDSDLVKSSTGFTLGGAAAGASAMPSDADSESFSTSTKLAVSSGVAAVVIVAALGVTVWRMRQSNAVQANAAAMTDLRAQAQRTKKNPLYHDVSSDDLTAASEEEAEVEADEEAEEDAA